MGDPKRRKKKYSKPFHPWEKDRIEEEKQLMEEYGLKNKKEIWKAASMLRNFTLQAKKLIAAKEIDAELRKKHLLQRLCSLGILKDEAQITDVLSINIRDILERRLQTIVFKKNMAKTIKQARQFVVHEHIMVGNKVIAAPSYLVKRDEEEEIRFSPNSPLAQPNHPEIVKILTKENGTTKD